MSALAGAWLVAVAGALGLPLGALAVLWIHALSSGRWGVVLGPALRRLAGLLPLAMVAFLPLLLALPVLMPFVATDPTTLPKTVAAKLGYLAPGWIVLRTLMVFAAWLAAWWLTMARAVIPQWLAVVGLCLYPAGLLLFTTDWMLALEPTYVSTTYPLLVGSAQLLGAFALAVVLTPASERDGDFGLLLISAILTWVYLAFMQWLITFMGNLPWETGWYLRRVDPAGVAVLLASAMLFAVVPFLALLPTANRQHPRRLRIIAWAIVAGYVAENLWRLLGAFEQDAALAVALVLGHAVVAVGVAWLLRSHAERWWGVMRHV
ncbi:MAG: hypothetical protein ACTHLT_06640 [Devosia sp.]